MKKFLSIILVVLLVSLTACSGETAYSDENNGDYRFADGWSVVNTQAVDAIDYIKKYEKSASNAYVQILNDVKTLIKENVAYSELLDWDKFDQLRTVKELDIAAEDAKGMSPEEILILSSYLAFYDEKSDSIYILPQFYTASAEQRVYAFAHEIIHSLVGNWGDVNDSRIVEGTVDYLALKLCNDLDIDIVAAYQEAIMCLRILMDIYGDEEVIQAVCENRIADLIDSSTKAGMSAKLNYALVVIHGDTNKTKEDIREATYAELDILSHVARHEGTNIDKWLNTIEAAYNDIGIKLNANRYFKF